MNGKITIPINKIEIYSVIDKLHELNIKCVTKINELTHDKKDVRLIIFISLSIHIQNLILGLQLAKNLCDDSFYRENQHNMDLIDQQYKSNILYHYLNSLSSTFSISIFIQIENYLRIVAKHKQIDAYKISQIIKKIIDEFQISDNNLKLWEIISYIRNSMHNGGFHSDNDIIINYKNKNNTSLNFQAAIFP